MCEYEYLTDLLKDHCIPDEKKMILLEMGYIEFDEEKCVFISHLHKSYEEIKNDV